LMPALQQMSGTVGQLTGRHYVGVPDELQKVGIAVGEMPPPATMPQTPEEAADLFMSQSDDASKEEMLTELEGAQKAGVTSNIRVVSNMNAILLKRLRAWKAVTHDQHKP